MINKTKKIILSLFISITAVVFFTLPFLMDAKILYVYSSQPLNTYENTYVKELGELGYKIKYNVSSDAKKRGTAIWFYSPEIIRQLKQSKANYNFLYTEEYNVVDLSGIKDYPIILTPHRAIYEHYMRSNMKTALLDIKTPKASAVKFNQILDRIKTN